MTHRNDDLLEDKPMQIILRGLDECRGMLSEIGRQSSYVLARTLSKTAVDVREAEVIEMSRVFDRPTPYTLKGVYAKTASKSDLNARVWLKEQLQAGKGNASEDYLRPQVFGGGRDFKKFEAALHFAGAIPQGYYCIPGDAAKLDGYGNMDRGQIVQILSYFKALHDPTAGMGSKGRKKLAKGTKTKRGTAYFVVPPKIGSQRQPGIYQRMSSAWGWSVPRPVLIFVKSVSYAPRYDFYGVGQKKTDEVWPGHFNAAFGSVLTSET